MAKSKYLTAPVPSEKMPGGIPYIIGNEAAERFSFYGMKAILTIFMTKYLVDSSGDFAGMSEEDAKGWFHLFTSAVYFTPIFGALIADIFFGKYKTILSLSVVYCLGHLALALDETRLGLSIGLTLIAIGSGGIKPCVSAHVGDQFGKTNQHLLSKVFGWFYFSINFGSTISTLATPFLLDRYGPHLAFGLPGLLMFVATVIFWMGRDKFIHIPPGGSGFVKETFSPEGIKAALKLSIIFVCVSPFWSLFDQTGSAWVLQAEKMDRQWLGVQWLSSQIQAVNPILVMILIPVFTYFIYPTVSKVFPMKPLRRIAVGLFIAGAAFAVSATIEKDINGGDVIKYTSRSKVERTSPTRVLDGESGLAAWSSKDAPTDHAPQELVIRLRERRAWMISSIEVDAGVMLNQGEMAMILDDLSLEQLKRLQSESKAGSGRDEAAAGMRETAERYRQAAKQVKRAESLDDARRIARESMSDETRQRSLFEDTGYRPHQVNLYAADFSEKLIPSLHSDGSETSLRDATEAKGWAFLGRLEFDQSATSHSLEFEPVQASHVLVQITSNHGAEWVKLGEVRVTTRETMPEESRKTAQAVWPNVAAIGYQPNIVWQLLAYLVLTAAEVMVSITCLEFAYTQSPRKMKSLIMSFYLLSISLGNIFVTIVNFYIQREDGSTILPGASYYWFWTSVMGVTACIFIIVALLYKEKTYIQEESPALKKALSAEATEEGIQDR